MSQYSIYRINHADPKLFGRKKNRHIIFFGLYTPFSLILINICLQVFEINILIISAVVLPSLIGIALLIYGRIDKDLKSMKTIGSVEFTKKHFIKKLGDFSREYDLNEIKRIELTRHILTSSALRGDCFSYILRLTFMDSVAETFIVSGQESGNNRNISITDTLRALDKLTQIQVLINNN